MRESAEKQLVQVQTIQRIVTTRNVTQDYGNINNFWKGSHWFCHQCLRTFCYFLPPESRKCVLGKLHLCPSIWTQTSPNWPSVLHSLHALPVAVFTISANSAARANHVKIAKVSILMCSFKYAHIYINTNAKMCFKSPLFKEIVWLLARNPRLTFFK